MRPRRSTTAAAYSSGVGAFQSRRAVANEASRLTKNFSRRIFDAYQALPRTIRQGMLAVAFVVAFTVVLLLRLNVISRNPNVVGVSKQNHHTSPQVCSHQLLNPPPLQPVPAVDGSLRALNALWTSDVTCFDIDVVTLKDGTLLAAHPRRLAKALKGTSIISDEGKIHDNTLKDIHEALLKGSERDKNFPFPLLDTELLPLYAKLVHGSHAFFDTHSVKRIRKATTKKSGDKRRLQGPLLNLDLKQGPYLTKEKLLRIVDTIHKLDIENYVAVCVTPLDDQNTVSLDMLRILHEHNQQQMASEKYPKPIPLGLVLRDLVKRDQDVSYIRKLATDYATSIRLLVPSFKFSSSWYQEISQGSDPLSQLPMTAWTIDKAEDYEYASQMNIAAVVANRPLEFL